MKASHLHPVKHSASWRTKSQVQALDRIAPVRQEVPGHFVSFFMFGGILALLMRAELVRQPWSPWTALHR